MSGIRYSGYNGINTHGLNRSLSQAEADGVDFFTYAGIQNLEEARKTDAQDLMEKFRNYAGIGSGLGPGGKMWSPVNDGKVQVDHFSEMILQNKRHMVPLLMSNTSSESWDIPKVSSMEELETLAQRMFGDRAGEFLNAVRAATLEETIRNAAFCPMELGMRLYFETTAKVRPELDNWGSVFAADIPGWDNPGTFHSSDLWFVFESLASCWRPFTGKHYDLARHICNYVSNFIKCGNPNGYDADGTPLAEWKPYRETKGQMRYGDTCAQLPDSSITSVTRFLTDFYLSRY